MVDCCPVRLPSEAIKCETIILIQLNESIRTATGELVEVGNAILNPINQNKWTYTTVADNPALAGGSVSVTAKDIPGNEGRLDLTL